MYLISKYIIAFALCFIWIQTISYAQDKTIVQTKITPDKQSKKTVLQSAIALYKKGNKKQAEQLLTDSIQKADYKNLSQRATIYQSYLTLADIYSRQSAFNKEVKLLYQLFTHLLNWKLANTIDGVTVRQRLAEALFQDGKETKGIKVLNDALILAKRLLPANHVQLANIRMLLAKRHINRLQVEQAEDLLKQSQQAIKNNKDKNSQILLGRILQARGELLFRQAKTKQASDIYLQAFQQRQQLLGLNHLETAQSQVSYASTLKGLHRFSEAEELFRQSFAIYDQQLSSDHVYISTILNNMGQMYYLQGRFKESEKALLRSLDIKNSHFNKNHIAIASTSNHLGYLYFLLEDYPQALNYLDNAIRIWSLDDSDRPRYRASAQTWKGVILSRQGKPEKAVKQLYQTISTLESIYGKQNIATADAYYYLGKILHTLSRAKEAKKAFKKGLISAGQFAQGDWLAEILIHAELSSLYIETGKLQQALFHAQKSLDGVQLRINRFSGLRAHSLTTELKSLSDAIINNISTIYHLLQSNPEKTIQKSKQGLLDLSFKAAQISRSGSVARALAQIEQRMSVGNNKLAEIIRQRQDLVEQWQEIDSLLTASMSTPENNRDREKEKELISLSKQIKVNLNTLEKSLKKDYPEYINMTQSPPLTITQVQKLLHKDESLLVYLFGKKKSYLWLVSPSTAEIFQLNITQQQLQRSVRRLRSRLVPRANLNPNYMSPFPVKQSFLLYKKILHPAMPFLEQTKTLFIVADQALQSLPLSVLVTQLPKQRIRRAAQHKQAAWLIKDKALSTLPAVSALSTLRNKTLSSSASKKYLGIGDPDLKKAQQKYQLRTRQLQLRSANKQITKDKNEQLLSRGLSLKNNATLRSIIGKRSADVDINQVSSMVELPDTADELRTVAQILSADTKDIYLRSRAVESQLLQADTDNYKIIQFATHGLMAGEFQGLHEPALVLTPDIENNILDNGLLTASDISQLKLNADFVVLSACNTAAPDGTPGAEGLSGLARAFLYAGSRALMVTHWAVISDAAVKMTTNIFAAISKKEQLSISMAHQQSTLKLINDKENVYYAHPLFWAPFMIVGTND